MVYLWKFYDDSSKQCCSWLYILLPDKADGTKRATFLTSHLQKRLSLSGWPLYLTSAETCHEMNSDKEGVRENVTRRLSHGNHSKHTGLPSQADLLSLSGLITWLARGRLFISLSLPASGLIQLATKRRWMSATQLASAW